MSGKPRHVRAAVNAVRILGGVYPTAARYGTSRQVVNNWVKTGLSLRAIYLVSKDTGIPAEQFIPIVRDISMKPRKKDAGSVQEE